MQRAFVTGGLILVVFSTASKPVKAEDPAVKIGFVQTMFKEVPPALIQAMQGPFRDVFKQQTGTAGEIEFLPDAETVANKIKAGTLNAGVFHGFEFAWVSKNSPDLIPLIVTIPHDSKLQGLLVVAAESSAKKPGDLVGPSVAVPKGLKAHSHLYFERLKQGLPAGALQTTGPVSGTPEEALNSVVTGNAKAALVDHGIMMAYKQLRPGAFNKLRILHESELFPVTVMAVKKGAIGADTEKLIKSGLTNANKSPQGKALMLLWNLKGFSEVPGDYQKQLDSVYLAYPPMGIGAVPAKAIATGME